MTPKLISSVTTFKLSPQNIKSYFLNDNLIEFITLWRQKNIENNIKLSV